MSRGERVAQPQPRFLLPIKGALRSCAVKNRGAATAAAPTLARPTSRRGPLVGRVLCVRGGSLGAPFPPKGGGERATRAEGRNPLRFHFWKKFTGNLWKNCGKIEHLFYNGTASSFFQPHEKNFLELFSNIY